MHPKKIGFKMEKCPLAVNKIQYKITKPEILFFLFANYRYLILISSFSKDIMCNIFKIIR